MVNPYFVDNAFTYTFMVVNDGTGPASNRACLPARSWLDFFGMGTTSILMKEGSRRDSDGTFVISRVVPVRTQCGGVRIAMKPDSTGQGSNVRAEVTAGKAQQLILTVASVNGQEVVKLPVTLQAGNNQITLPSSQWAAGTIC